MKYIILKTKEDFHDTMKLYKKDHKVWLWNHFKGDTCYVPEENYFINLDKAKNLGIEL